MLSLQYAEESNYCIILVKNISRKIVRCVIIVLTLRKNLMPHPETSDGFLGGGGQRLLARNQRQIFDS